MTENVYSRTDQIEIAPYDMEADREFIRSDDPQKTPENPFENIPIEKLNDDNWFREYLSGQNDEMQKILSAWRTDYLAAHGIKKEKDNDKPETEKTQPKGNIFTDGLRSMAAKEEDPLQSAFLDMIADYIDSGIQAYAEQYNQKTGENTTPEEWNKEFDAAFSDMFNLNKLSEDLTQASLQSPLPEDDMTFEFKGDPVTPDKENSIDPALMALIQGRNQYA